MRYSVNQTKSGLAEVQTTLHWKMSFIKAPSAIGSPSDNIIIRCNSAAVPEAQVEYNTVELQGHTIKYVGKVTKAGQITLQFIEGTDAAVTNYFMNWNKAIWSGDGTDTYGVQNLTADLKADIKLELMDPTDKVTQTYTLIGCMPTTTMGMTLEQAATNVNPSVNIDYDDFHISTDGINW